MKIYELITCTQKIDKVPGIYIIYCVPANKAYIGQSKNIHRRIVLHKSCLKKLNHPNVYLQNVYNKYGKDSFFFSILEVCSVNLTEREAHYLHLLDKDCRLNLAPISYLVRPSELFRQKLCDKKKLISKETRDKIAASKRGIALSSEHRLKISSSLKGRKHTTETKLKMKRKFSEEHKKKLSYSAKHRKAKNIL